MGILNAYEAYCFDEAVWRFGTAVEAEVDEAGKSKGKKDTSAKQEQRRDQRLREMLGLPKVFRPIPSSKIKSPTKEKVSG